MSRKSRHVPLPTASHYQYGSGSNVPRHQALPDYRPSFSSATHGSNMIDSHYSLSSSTSGSRHGAELSQWSHLSSRPQPDDFMSAGFESMNVAETFDCNAMMTSEPLDNVYGLPAANVISRHAPLSNLDQVQVLPQDYMMQDYLSEMEYSPCTTTMDTSMAGTDSWTRTFDGRPPSPPDEEEIALGLQRHALCPQETMDCEALGFSNTQAYSPPRHSVVQPRPIRPYLERSETQHSSRHSASPMSSSDDSTGKTRADKGDAKARKDPLYDAPHDKDGYFRCPLVEQFGCSHKPTKQRCIYAKYLDSHLRPYKCRYPNQNNADCSDARFSSNACLFRHEREAHGQHGHGENPYLCKFPNCPRAKRDNGFPRSWNQKDHMKRVHQWDSELDEEEQRPSLGRHAPDAKRRKGSNGPSSVQMKRSESYYSRTSTAPYTREGRHAAAPSRHQTVAYNAMNTGSLMEYPVFQDEMQLHYSVYQPVPTFSPYSQAVY